MVFVEYYFGILKKKKYMQLMIFFLIIFLYSFGWGLLTPIFSIRIQQITKDVLLTGFIFSIFGLVRVIFDLPVGLICDRYSLKKIIIFSLTIYVPLIIFYALVNEFRQLVIIRVVHAIVAVLFWNSVWTYLRRTIQKRYETEGISIFSFFSDLASTTAPIIGGFIALFYWQLPFYLLSLICLMLLVVVHFKLPDLKITTKHSIITLIKEDISQIKNLFHFFLPFSLIIILFFSIWSFFNNFLPIFLNEMGLSYEYIGILIALTTLPIIFSEIKIGEFIDLRGKKYAIVIVCVLYSVSFLLFPLFKNIFIIFLLLGIISLSNIIFYLSTNSIIVDISKNEQRGIFTGLFSMLQDIGIFAGPLIGGFLLQRVSYTKTFLFCAVLSFIILVLTINLKFKK
ncbi:MAG: MFS transporter [Candidatus Nanoarchaeia archaeon]|nr:MFS transporter [Candidatus Jingweiarchaeum tengchongense]